MSSSHPTHASTTIAAPPPARRWRALLGRLRRARTPVGGATPTAGAVAVETGPLPARPGGGAQGVVELVHALRNHIDHQADRSERLVRSLDGLPEALRSLPESNANARRVLSLMQQHLEQQQVQGQQLAAMMNSVVEAARQRDQAVTLLESQISAAQQKDAELVKGLGLLGDTMQKIGAIQERSAEVLQRIAETAGQSEARMRLVLDLNRRQARAGVFGAAAAIAVLLAMTGYVAVSAARLAKATGAPMGVAAPGAGQKPPPLELGPARAAAPDRRADAGPALPPGPAATDAATPGTPPRADLTAAPGGTSRGAEAIARLPAPANPLGTDRHAAAVTGSRP